MRFLISAPVARKFAGTLAMSVAAAVVALNLAGCTATVSLDAAPDSNNPACAAVSVRLPSDVDGNKQRDTNAQATGAWGTPVRVILRCGLPEVRASTLLCTTIGGVDWLVDPSQAPSYRFITFGRKPATEVIVDYKHASGVSSIDALSQAVAEGTKVDRLCVDPKTS